MGAVGLGSPDEGKETAGPRFKEGMGSEMGTGLGGLILPFIETIEDPVIVVGATVVAKARALTVEEDETTTADAERDFLTLVSMTVFF